MACYVTCRIGPIECHVVRKGHVAHAKIVVGAQCPQRILDRVPALHTQQRTDFALRERLPYVGGGIGPLQILRILRDHAARDIDLLELHTRVARVLHFAWDVHRPELSTHLTTTQSGEIGHPLGGLAQIVRLDIERRIGVLAHRPRQIVM